MIRAEELRVRETRRCYYTFDCEDGARGQEPRMQHLWKLEKARK